MILLRSAHSVLLAAIEAAPVRFALRIFALGVLALISAAAVARAEGGAAVEAGTPAEPVLAAGAPAEERIAYFSAIGREHWAAGDRVAAERAFASALNSNVATALKRDLLLEMSELYRASGDPLRAIAVLEKFRDLFPNDGETASILLRLGLLHREVGALDAASKHFFQVLNSTLRVDEAQFAAYRALAMKARFEIAETYAMRGELDEARRYFSRLEVLDLAPGDRERVAFRGAQLLHAQGLWVEAEVQLARFIETHPESEATPEARHLRATALEQLGRRDDAIQEVVALLRSQDSADPARVVQANHWKRRTGNELANRFYEQGDVTGALAIYQAIAGASEAPEWRWPAVYQIGLCFERLNLPFRAVEAFKVILEADAARTAGAPLPKSLASIRTMAEWRLAHLDWVEDFGKRLQGYAVDLPTDS